MLPCSYDPILPSSSYKQPKATSLHIPWLPTQTVEYTDPTLRAIQVARHAGTVILGELGAKGVIGFSGVQEKVEEFGK